MTELVEPKRVKKLRLGLAKAIPKSPNNKSTLEELRSKPLGSLLVDFVNWRSRYVGERPREVTLEPRAATDARWTVQSTGIRNLLAKVRAGEDLTPQLSIEPHARGYSPGAHAPGASSEDKWSDKDFLLAANGYHHFHLGTKIERRGHATRTNELIFAHVTRDNFHIIALFDHSVFDPLSAERTKLHQAHEEFAFRGIAPGTPVIMGAIATSGHTIQVVRYAQHCARTIADIDTKLDDRSFFEPFFAKSGRSAPKQPKWDWGFNHLDLGIFDKTSKVFFTLVKGWN